MTPGQQRLNRVLDDFLAEGVEVVAANEVADRLWPDGRYTNTKGQMFHLSSAIAARMLRANRRAIELEFRRWTILPGVQQR